ncbi:IclR family transcriptional regulator [Fodinicola acaciae]|uniref:IclR family transcriptional regulator n=1 Tax=Fodinicola acaciae TaxID=2681555 RepID=UPI0013CF97FB|nr:IclR family transcriptional regulator [Fodinicola acaciae]
MQEQIPAVRRALEVLRLLAARPAPLPASTIARELGLPRSSTYHLLNALADQGFVTHLPEERRYSLGVAAFEIGSAYLRVTPLERLGRPLLTKLVADIGFTAHLGVLHGRETLYVIEARPPRPEPLVTDVGVRLPAQLTASGRAMLAALPANQLRALFPSADTLVDRTGVGPRTLTALRRTLTAERKQGYAEEDGEVTEGYASVAVAVRDHTGRPAAAVATTFRSGSLDHAGRAQIARLVRKTADTFTRRLGGTP